MKRRDGIMAAIVWAAWLALGIGNIYADGKLPIVMYIAGSVCYAIWYKLFGRSFDR